MNDHFSKSGTPVDGDPEHLGQEAGEADRRKNVPRMTACSGLDLMRMR